MPHGDLWERLEKCDGQQIARRAKCCYTTDPGANCYTITFLNQQYHVGVEKRQIFLPDADESSSAPFLEQLCILAYLLDAKDMPLSNKIVNAKVLPGGAFFFRGIHDLPTAKLAATFGGQPAKLYDVMDQLNGKRCDYGDASIEFLVLPRVPLTVVIWAEDDEFAARASILFDQTAAEHMPLDALGAAADRAAAALINAAKPG